MVINYFDDAITPPLPPENKALIQFPIISVANTKYSHEMEIFGREIFSCQDWNVTRKIDSLI